MMTSADPRGLCSFVDSSPSPFHVVDTVGKALRSAGFHELTETDPWSDEPGRFFVVRSGSIIAWDASSTADAFRIVGGHTDSPNLRFKQHPDISSAGMSMVGLEPYGGAWLNSWLDRDLGVCGRLSLIDGQRMRTRLVTIPEPVLRVPQLAIHLSDDRKGVSLDPQRHVNAIWTIDTGASFIDWLCEHENVDRSEVLGWELMAYDVMPSRVFGVRQDMISAPRLDNQGTCYAGLRALLDGDNTSAVRVLALFDHEEVGSGSERGAGSDFLVSTLERIVLSHNGDREKFLQTMAASVCVSGDMAHGTHPNYPERHEPAHQIILGQGPVLKVNQNLRYASDAEGEALFAAACRQADVPLQRYVHRADLPCGSTIGPITASRTGLKTVDVGAAQLAMHSAREMMAAADIATYSLALQAFLSPH